MPQQLALFDQPVILAPDLITSRSGTFIDNLKLPVHRWFRYSAGFAAQWAEQLLQEWEIRPDQTVMDPFAGSGTVSIVCDTRGVPSIGVEAHPVVARIAQAKLLWTTSIERFTSRAAQLLEYSQKLTSSISAYPALIQRSFSPETLLVLDRLKTAWAALHDDTPESELTWLALTAILRPTAHVGTAQWQYILPNKTKHNVQSPLNAYQQQIELMQSDMRWMQARADVSCGRVQGGDARRLNEVSEHSIDAVITSPPYANNYDYADALRFEMTFWGEVTGWGDLHAKVRQYLIVSSSQHASHERLDLTDLLTHEVLAPIRPELQAIALQLAAERKSHGGQKHYHTMMAAYCRDLGLTFQELRRVCKPGARMCWVIGDSAPYGVYCPIDTWLGELALSAGFKAYRFEKLRDRNIKWKNRKHRVPLKEGLLWIEG